MAEIIELNTTQKGNRNDSFPNSKTNKTVQKKQKLDSSGILDQDNPYNIMPIYQKTMNDPVEYIVFDQTDKIKSMEVKVALKEKVNIQKCKLLPNTFCNSCK